MIMADHTKTAINQTYLDIAECNLQFHTLAVIIEARTKSVGMQ